MNRFTTVLFVAFECVLANVASAHMGPGPVPFDTAAACYNPITGEIFVSVNDMETWSVRSSSFSLTGAAPTFPSFPGAFNSDNDSVIGQSVFQSNQAFTYFDHNFGPVAAKGLPVSDLTLYYSYAFNPPQVSVPVTLCVPEAATLPMILAVIVSFRRIKLPLKNTSHAVNFG